MQAYVALQNKFKIAQIKINSANVYQEMDNYGQAEILYNEAREILQRVAPERQELYIIDFNLGLQAQKLGHYQQALRHLERARAGFIPEAHIALVDINRAGIYSKLNLSKEALVLARNAAQFYKQAEIPYELAQSLRFQAIAWRRLGELELSRHALLEARHHFADQNSRRYLVIIDLILAELALDGHEIEQASQLTTELANLVDEALWPNLASEVYLLQARISLAALRRGDLQAETDLQSLYTMLQKALHVTKQHPQPQLMLGIYHLLSRFYILQVNFRRKQ